MKHILSLFHSVLSNHFMKHQIANVEQDYIN